jgi:hypothetical protein
VATSRATASRRDVNGGWLAGVGPLSIVLALVNSSC